MRQILFIIRFYCHFNGNLVVRDERPRAIRFKLLCYFINATNAPMICECPYSYIRSLNFNPHIVIFLIQKTLRVHLGLNPIALTED